MLRKFVTFAMLLVFAAACNQDDEVVDYGPIDEKIIQDYIAAKGLTTQSTASGLHYIIEKPGSANHPGINSKVTVKYKGYLTNGTVFDESTILSGKPATFNLSSLIKGWQEGLQFIGVGGKIKLLVPSALGYGSSSSSATIPANSVLVFDIELVQFI
jgi:FKBP-type peptidyl-prolyl cis-trans isomerase FkpA